MQPNEMVPILRRLPYQDVVRFSSASVHTRRLVQGVQSRLQPAVVAYVPHFVLAMDDAGNAYKWALAEGGVVLQRRQVFAIGDWVTVSEPLLHLLGWRGNVTKQPDLAVSGGEVVAVACGMGGGLHVFKLCERKWVSLTGDRPGSIAQSEALDITCRGLGWDAATQRAMLVVLDGGAEVLMATSDTGRLVVVNALPASEKAHIHALSNGDSTYIVSTYRDGIPVRSRMYRGCDGMPSVDIAVTEITEPSAEQQLAWLGDMEEYLRAVDFWPAELSAFFMLATLHMMAPGSEPMVRQSCPGLASIYGNAVLHVDCVDMVMSTGATTYSTIDIVFVNGIRVGCFRDVTSAILANEAVAIMTAGTDVVRLDRTPTGGWEARVVTHTRSKYQVHATSDRGDYAILLPHEVEGDILMRNPCVVVYCGQPRA